MIYELKIDSIEKISNYADYNYIKNDLKSNPFGKILVYEENNFIIGYIYYSDIYERVEINKFEIDISHRNCGKGNELLRKLTKTVDKNITLEVRYDNYPAITLYIKNGFKKVAIRKGYYNGKDGILMERKKDSG